MSEKMNFKQLFFSVVVGFILGISVLALMALLFFAVCLAFTDTANTDDIFGSAGYIFGALFIVGDLIPYLVSLAVLLHGGYYALEVVPFSKRLHYISSGIALTTVFSYGVIFAGIVFRFIPRRIYASLDFQDPFLMVVTLASLISVVMDIVGMILRRHRLESDDPCLKKRDVMKK